MKNLNEWSEYCYEEAKHNGWHQSDGDGHPDVYEMLIITELSEAVNADRKKKHADRSMFEAHDLKNDALFSPAFQQYIKDTVEDEIADVCIRCFDYAHAKSMDLDAMDEPIWGLEIEEKDTPMEFCCTIYGIVRRFASRLEEREKRVRLLLKEMLELADYMDFDLEYHIEQKLRYNRLRGQRHGNKEY